MKARPLLLDVVANEIVGRQYKGRLYGLPNDEATGRPMIIASTAPSPGLVQVVTTGMGVVGPQISHSGGADGTWIYSNERCDLRCEIRVVPYSVDYSARQVGLVDPTILGRKRAVVIGVGSLGFFILQLLARSGVGTLLPVDNDTVELVNLNRSGYLLEQLGIPKVDAATELLVRANPRINIEPRREEVRPDNVADVVKDADIVIGSASTATGFLLAAHCHPTVPLVLPALYARAAAGEIFVSRGPIDTSRACFCCFRSKAAASATPTNRANWNYDSAGELSAEPGLGPDISVVASVAASLAISILAGTSEQAMPADGGQLLLVSNRNGAVLDTAHETKWARVPRNPDCPNHGQQLQVSSNIDSLLASIPEITSV